MKTEDNSLTLTSLCFLEGVQFRNIEYVLDGIERAVSGKSKQIIVTPFMSFLQFREERQEEDLEDFVKLASKHEVILVVALREQSHGKIYHTSVVIDDRGGIVGKYRKSQRTDQDDADFVLGDSLEVVDVGGVRLGLTLTSDFYFMEIYTVLWMKGADILIWQHEPEHFREHSTWHALLENRAKDYHCFLVTAMYADEAFYLTNKHDQSIRGSPFGRSMILSRDGIVISDTAYYDGIATAVVYPDRRKKTFIPQQNHGMFYVSNRGDRKAFAPIAEPYVKPEYPEFRKRVARIVTTARMRGRNWVDDVYPQSIFNLLKRAETLNPDLILFSEESTRIRNLVTQRAMKDIGEWAAANQCYVVVGGLRDDDGGSVARLWDRSGNMVFSQRIYWSKGTEEINVFDADFARIGIRTCGDVFLPEVNRVLALKGAELILDPTLMWGPDGHHNRISGRTRAIDDAVYVVTSHFHSSDFGLRSEIIDPYGQVIVATPYGDEELAYADIDFTRRRFYFAGDMNSLPVFYDEYEHWEGPVPPRQNDWQEMLFRHRRPELYGIIPTENEVTRAAIIKRLEPRKAKR